MRKKLVAGNWKMNKTPSEAVSFIEELIPLTASAQAEVVLCVPAIDIVPAVLACRETNIGIGAENMYFEEQGAFTGEISPAMVKDAGAKYVILGHSERRGYFGETSSDVNKKMKKAIEHGLIPIMCCGESLEQRQSGITFEWIGQQIKEGYSGIAADEALNTVIAYEPIWAIGTGQTASDSEAEEACFRIRQVLGELYGKEVSESIRILYGGSVNSKNAAGIFRMPNIDGGLVGGASLNTEFAKIVNFDKD